MLTGCATTQSNTISSGSMCLDGLKANMLASGCKKVNTKQVHPFAMKIACEKDDSTQNNFYTKSSFLAVKQRTMALQRNWEPLCGDPDTVLVKEHE